MESIDQGPDFAEQTVNTGIPRHIEIAIRRAAKARAKPTLSADWLLGLGPQLILTTCLFFLVALMWVSL